MPELERAQELRSMTGFGRAVRESNDLRAVCEIRSLNHRGLDLKFRLPQFLYSAENQYQKLIHAAFVRGRVDVFIEVARPIGENKQVKFNVSAAHEMVKQLKAFQSKHDEIEGDISVGHLLGVKELFSFEGVGLVEEDARLLATQVLEMAISDAVRAREEEGHRLQKIIADTLVVCEELVKVISHQLVSCAPKYYEDLTKRIAQITGAKEWDDARMAQEIAHIVQRADVAEEIHRLGAHIAHFRDLSEAGGAVGRKLDFLCQEMFREANTASSKITDPATTFLVVDLKSEIERIREQVQNLE